MVCVPGVIGSGVECSVCFGRDSFCFGGFSSFPFLVWIRIVVVDVFLVPLLGFLYCR